MTGRGAHGVASQRDQLLLTCEHARNRVPREYAARFRAAKRELASHRGFDPGALGLARRLSHRFGVPLHDTTWSRLLVETNRAPHNPRIWSRYTAGLPAEEKRRILERYYWPHRREVEAVVAAAAAAGRRVVHVAVHSFTAAIDGERRAADVGLLYDPRRPRERGLAVAWQAILRELDSRLRVRRNYPYLGVADGLATWLRGRFPDRVYAGFELEVNQAVFAGPRRRAVERVLAESLERLLGSRVGRRMRRSRAAPRDARSVR